ncbi:MAG: mobile mystery protein A, partial [Bdellovibrionota bacterium]
WSASRAPRPRHGWLKAVRESLGMTSRQLAEALGSDNAAVLRMEKREILGKVTLETLSRAAQAMNCKLVYAIVPEESLERVVDDRAREAAGELLKPVSHSMKLEDQSVTWKASEAHLEELAQELKTRLDSALWTKRK